MASGRSAQARPAGRRRVAGQRSHPAVRPDETAAPDPAAGGTDGSSESTVEDVATERGIAAPEPAAEAGAGEDHVHVIPRSDADADADADANVSASASASASADVDEGPAAAKTARIRLDRLPGWLPLLSCVLIVLFLATSAVLGWRLYEGHAREVSRNDVLRIAPSYAARIFSFDYRHLEQDAKGAHPLLVGQYRQDYDKSMKRRTPDYTKYHFVVKSTLASAGVSEASAGRVRVVALIDQTVTAGVSKPATVPEQTRLAMTFERHDGKWLLAKIATL